MDTDCGCVCRQGEVMFVGVRGQFVLQCPAQCEFLGEFLVEP